MRTEYLNLLPEAAQKMAHDIEALIGSEIVIRPRTREDARLVPDETIAFCDSYTAGGQTTVTIAYPGTEIRRHILVHELLHAHRNLLQSIPQLRAPPEGGRYLAAIASRIENDIEHLYIIPMEVHLAPEAADYWADHYDQKIEELMPRLANNQEISLHEPIYEDILRHWLITHAALPGSSPHLRLAEILDSLSVGPQIRQQAKMILLAEEKVERLVLTLKAAGHPVQFFEFATHRV